MKELQLEPRLALLATLVPKGAHLADIGTDHGYLPVYLLQNRLIAHAIASDINALPLDHAKRTAGEFGITEHIEFRLCAGLDTIASDECDTVVIAGMGGETIIKILENALWTLDGKHTLLLQSQTKQELLRPWLIAHGGRIESEHLVRDKGTIYAVLTVTRGEQKPLNAAQGYCGVMNPHEPLYGDYAQERIEKLEHTVEGLKTSNRMDKAERIAALLSIISELKQSREEWFSCQP